MRLLMKSISLQSWNLDKWITKKKVNEIIKKILIIIIIDRKAIKFHWVKKSLRNKNGQIQ